MENEKEINHQDSLPLYEWDKEIVHPFYSHEAAVHVAVCFGIGIGYAESRYVAPYVAHDLLEW